MAHKLTLNLDVFSPLPLYLQIAAQVKIAVETRRLGPSERLPSIRDFAKQLQLSQSTIREAIAKLVEWDLVIARPGSGNYINPKSEAAINATALAAAAAAENAYPPGSAGGSPALSAAKNASKGNSSNSENLAESQKYKPEDNETDEAKFSVQTFVGEYHELSTEFDWSREARALNNSLNDHPFHPWWNVDLPCDFRSGESSFDFMQGPRWERIISSWAVKLSSMQSGYSHAAGLPELRAAVATWLNQTRSLECDPENILITTGAQQARDIIAQLLVNEGTKVVVEEPGSITDLLSYESRGATLAHVEQDHDGIRTSLLNNIDDAKLAHIISTANFPTGATLSLARRHELIEWASKNQTIIVEDAYGAGFYYETPLPTLYQLAAQSGQRDLIVYHGSFSQPFMPSLRIGFVLVPDWLKKAYFRTKWLSDRHPSSITQTLLLELFQEGFFEDHFLKLRAAANKRRQSLFEALSKWPLELIEFHPINAGFQQAVWFRNEEEIDDLLVFEKAMSEGIGIIPLSPYWFADQEERQSTSQNARRNTHGMLLNFLRVPEKQIGDGMEKLLNIVQNCRKTQFEEI